jgi:hypothetical protein
MVRNSASQEIGLGDMELGLIERRAAMSSAMSNAPASIRRSAAMIAKSHESFRRLMLSF